MIPLCQQVARRTEPSAFVHDPGEPGRGEANGWSPGGHLEEVRAVGAARADVAILTGARRPVPDPPQHRHGVRRVPAHAPHPDRPFFFPRAAPAASDQRAHRRHSSLPDPPHASQRGAPHRSAGPPPPGLHCAAPSEEDEEDLLAMATPASIPSPADATAIAATILTD